jgi:hypothetical protein
MCLLFSFCSKGDENIISLPNISAKIFFAVFAVEQMQHRATMNSTSTNARVPILICIRNDFSGIGFCMCSS